MKTIIKYINEKQDFLIKGHTKAQKNVLSNIFNNFEELIEGLELYFNSASKEPYKLIKPVKISKNEVVFSKIYGSWDRDGVYVGKHTTFYFDKNYRLRVGERKEGVIFQFLYKAYNGTTAYERATYPEGLYYRYDTNFNEWLESLTKDKRDFRHLLKTFNKEKV